MHERMHVGNQQTVNLVYNIILHLICVVQPYFRIHARSHPASSIHSAFGSLRDDTLVWKFIALHFSRISDGRFVRSCQLGCCIEFSHGSQANSPTHYKFAWKIYGKLFSLEFRKRRLPSSKPLWFIECAHWKSLDSFNSIKMMKMGKPISVHVSYTAFISTFAHTHT